MLGDDVLWSRRARVVLFQYCTYFICSTRLVPILYIFHAAYDRVVAEMDAAGAGALSLISHLSSLVSRHARRWRILYLQRARSLAPCNMIRRETVLSATARACAARCASARRRRAHNAAAASYSRDATFLIYLIFFIQRQNSKHALSRLAFLLPSTQTPNASHNPNGQQPPT